MPLSGAAGSEEFHGAGTEGPYVSCLAPWVRTGGWVSLLIRE